ncbi:YHYH domain-containing protein [Rivibacter subsaxonicus]|uniref:YHYH domain-containing protein n=1 Tax=Rivibacter subsaxonicus TaxID=457575 RepID=UPI003BF81FCA
MSNRDAIRGQALPKHASLRRYRSARDGQNMKLQFFVAGLIACVNMATAHAHGGGLNSDGCHNNRKTGDYHCHRAPTPVVQPVSPTPQQPHLPAVHNPPAASQVTAQPRADQVQTVNGQQCFVGPRGGTYTITASGRKNYSGC